jgi:hypothetical protein
MAGSGGSQHRQRLSAPEIERAQRVLHLSWLTLPAAHRALLESIGASQSQAVDQPLGEAVDSFLRSAGHRGLPPAMRRKLDLALGVWLQELRIVLIDVGHPKITSLDQATYEAFIARMAWHEWGHALSVVRCSREDIATGGSCSLSRQRASGRTSAKRDIVPTTTRTSLSLRRMRCCLRGAGEGRLEDHHG